MGLVLIDITLYLYTYIDKSIYIYISNRVFKFHSFYDDKNMAF